MGLHRVHVPDAPLEPGAAAVVEGEEAQHAVRVKRLGEGDPLELIDGRGRLALARVESLEKLGKKQGWSLRARVESVRLEPRPEPAVRVRSSTPKGPRLEQLIDQLAQVGAASWGPLITRRTVVDPREGKLARLERVAAEASKQCGRAWHLEIEPALGLDEALRSGGRLFVADASGEDAIEPGEGPATVLVGPEGGFEAWELDRARAAGARVVRLGPHAMRIETAAVVAAAAVLRAAPR